MDETEHRDTGEEEARYDIVGVHFDKHSGTLLFSRNHINLKTGDLVIAETDRGEGLGIVVQDGMRPGVCMPSGPLKKLLRKASQEDVEKEKDRRNQEIRAFRICSDKARAHKLDLNLVDVHYYFDRTKAIFYFTAEGRVDFRELVKNLAKELNTRIEMRQIGVRDKARLVGGVGGCGRELCCKSFLEEFEPVSVRMAKDQSLPLNPSKISGVCGRLMCCLTFEHKTYKQLCKDLPKCGKKVQTPDGPGKVTRQNPLKGTVVVEMEDGKEIRVSSKDLDFAAEPKAKGPSRSKAESKSKGESRTRAEPQSKPGRGSGEDSSPKDK